jgi:hypothetical protein
MTFETDSKAGNRGNDLWHRQMTPRPVQHGGRVGVLQTPDLFAPAYDRNALATPTAGDDRNALATPTAGGIALAG